jgi:BolA family transcriptional regulator, general stress-responsive regulator
MTRKERILQTLQSVLSPIHLEVIDESYMHSVPQGAESHFKVVAVSEHFAEQRLVGRHRLVNQALREEFQNGMHALALHTWTPQEWFEKGGAAPASPQCMGGSKSEKADRESRQ